MQQVREGGRFCAFAPKRGKIKEMVMFCVPLSERSCRRLDHHCSPRGCSAPAFSREADRKMKPCQRMAKKARAQSSARKAVMS